MKSPAPETAHSPDPNGTSGLRGVIFERVDSGSRDFVEAIPVPVTIALLLPAVVIVIALALYPLAIVIITSLLTDHGLSVARYVEFFESAEALRSLQRTFVLATVSTLGCLLLSIPLAYTIRNATHGRTLLRVLIMTPLAIPVLIAAYALAIFLGDRGILNNLLVHVLHVLPKPVGLSYTWTGLVISCIWRYFPYFCTSNHRSA